MKKSLFLVAFNPYFSKKMGTFWEKKKINPIPIGNQHVLVKTTPKIVDDPGIQPFIIRAQEMHEGKNLKEIQAYILEHADPARIHALRAWMIGHPTLGGRDIEVKLGMALEKKGIRMKPTASENVWFVLITRKKGFVSTQPLTMDAHLFPYQDAKLTEEDTITRSGKKLRFLLERVHMNVAAKHGVDLGCGSGGWTHTLLEKGARHITAIDRTKLDKGLQKNKKVTYLPQKAEDTPKIKEKPDFLVQDINVGPAHAEKIFLAFDRKNPGAGEALLTFKIMRGKDLEAIPLLGTKWGKWKVKGLANTWWARRECYVYLTNN